LLFHRTLHKHPRRWQINRRLTKDNGARVGGLLVSQLLTLYTTPVVYLYLDQLRARIAGTGRQPAGREASPAPAE
jgi:hypothetical protein